MLAITSKSPYAVSALVELARTGGSAPVPIGESAKRRNIPWTPYSMFGSRAFVYSFQVPGVR